jgi:hypothetical protein
MKPFFYYIQSMETPANRKLPTDVFRRILKAVMIPVDEALKLIREEIVNMSPLANKYVAILSQTGALYAHRLSGWPS